MHRSRLAILGAAGLTVLLSGCDSPPTPYPPTTPVPTAPTLAPQTMVLRPDQMKAYLRTQDSTVDAGTLADQEGDQTLVARLKSQGLQLGARVSFSDPNQGGAATPFATVISQVIFFHDATGATAFVSDETKRRAVPPTGGTLSPIPNLPLGGADSIVGMAASTPAQSTGEPPSRAVFAIIRRGSVVAELLGGGPASTATDANFTALVQLQEQQLSAKTS
ncbi:MAG TPA: hypothetical protein VN193_08580 [Candidatus Angelobacter sp.]|jgi:hypothetical protein|nr:hypothetical protein [Candidatus Angelobacter sp.]